MNGGFWTWMAQLNARRIFMVLFVSWVLLGAWMMQRDRAKRPVVAAAPTLGVPPPVADKTATGRGAYRPRMRREPISNLFTSPTLEEALQVHRAREAVLRQQRAERQRQAAEEAAALQLLDAPFEDFDPDEYLNSRALPPPPEPSPPEPVEPIEPAPRIAMRYRGVFHQTDGARIAFIEMVEDHRTLRLQVGDELAGHPVTAIEPGVLELKGPDGPVRLPVNEVVTIEERLHGPAR